MLSEIWVIEYSRLVKSISVALIWIFLTSSSLNSCEPIAARTGGSFTGFTVTMNSFDIDSKPSVIVTVIFDVPKALSFGFKVITLSLPVVADKRSIEIFSDSIKSLLLELTVTDKLSSKSTSKGIILIEISDESSSTTWSEISLNDGASFILSTSKLNVKGSESIAPSFAMIVSSAEPYWSEMELIVRIFELILVLINEELEFVTVYVNSVSPSTSIAFKSRFRDCSSRIFWSGIETTLGASFIELIVILNDLESSKGGSGQVVHVFSCKL